MTQRQVYQILRTWNLTQVHAASLLGVSTNTIYRWSRAVELNTAEADQIVNDAFWVALLSKIKAESHEEGLKRAFMTEGRLGAYRYIIDAYDKSLQIPGV